MRDILSSLLKKKVVIGVAVLLLVGGYVGWRTYSGNGTPAKYVLDRVSKGTLVVSVTGTGQVSAVNQIMLHPLISGTITSVRVANGDWVAAGKILAALDVAGAQASLDQAKAALSVAKVTLENNRQSLGIVAHQQQVLVDNAHKTLLNSSLAAVPAANNTAALSSNTTVISSPTVSGTYLGPEGNYLITITGYSSSGTGNAYTVSGLEQGGGFVSSSGPTPLGTHGLFIQFPTATVYIGDSWIVPIPNTRSSSYLANLNAYEAALETQSAAVNTAQASVNLAEVSLEQATAAEEVAENTYHDNFIAAPFAGTIGQWNIQLGDQVSGSTNAGVLVTPEKMAQISLSEVDAAKVNVGQKAMFAFDALPGLTLTGRVASIDLVGTVTQGVVTYNAKVAFDTQDDRVKPGMTVNATIIIDSKQNVLLVPNSALKRQSGVPYVEIPAAAVAEGDIGNLQGILLSPAPTRQSVEVGITNDQLSEVTAGLKEGDVIVVRTIQSTSSTQSSSQSSPLFRIGGGGGARGLR